jgi:molybdopterin synthase sulfur carrier subunit
MTVTVQFFSYLKDLCGVELAQFELPEASTVQTLLNQVWQRFPQAAKMSDSTLVALHMEYASRDQILYDHAQIALFPPVQGG